MREFLRPDTLAQAVALRGAGARVVAGGTDIYPAAGSNILGSSISGSMLDICGLPGLRGIWQDEGGLRIGAATTWSDIIEADLPPAFAALQQAAAEVGGRQIQNAGTIGGNLCNASPAADGVPPLLVLGALVELVSPRGTRHLPLTQFLKGPRQTDLAADEVMTAVRVPPEGQLGRSAFLKLGARAYLVISIAMVAVRLNTAGGKVTDAALSVGACSAVARRLPEVEKALVGLALPKLAQHIRDADVARALSPIDDIRATGTYRADVAAELLRRAVGAISA